MKEQTEISQKKGLQTSELSAQNTLDTLNDLTTEGIRRKRICNSALTRTVVEEGGVVEDEGQRGKRFALLGSTLTSRRPGLAWQHTLVSDREIYPPPDQS